ncbi:hypothetical protein A259_28560, partial [Pseudomonas syringae pv. actinidiae ICMP 19070]
HQVRRDPIGKLIPMPMAKVSRNTQDCS